jgi:hypothetical protein
MTMFTIGSVCRAHDQDDFQFCGEAVEMMICASQPGVVVTSLKQAGLFLEANPQGLPGNLFTGPADIAAVLKNHLPGRGFSVQQAATADDAMRGIISALQTSRAPVAVLAQAGTHWIVVAGVQTDVDPQSGPYHVQHVSFNTPNPLSQPLQQHTDQDICCGCINGMSRGTLAGSVQPYRDWLNDWLTSAGALAFTYVSATLPATLGTTLAAKLPIFRPLLRALRLVQGIGKSVEPAGAGPIAGVSEGLQPDIMAPEPPPALDPVPPPFSEQQRVEEGRRGLATILLPGTPLRTALDLLSGAEAGPALDVQRLDDESRHYFLVPWSLGGKVVATIKVDGATGRFAGAQFHGRPWFSELGSDSEARQQRLSELGIDAGVAPDQLSLVWQPCQQSFSPHLPFLRIRSKQQAAGEALPGAELAQANGGGERFVRLDGTIFPSLTRPGLVPASNQGV